VLIFRPREKTLLAKEPRRGVKELLCFTSQFYFFLSLSGEAPLEEALPAHEMLTTNIREPATPHR
jgi:hypothetical protein